MNYDLLKLSKILPTINGRKIVDIYQERLDVARQTKQEQLGQKLPFDTVETLKQQQRIRVETPKKELRVADAKSLEKFSPIKFDGEGHQVHLKGARRLTENRSNVSPVKNGKIQRNFQLTTSTPFFNKRESPEESAPGRPLTSSPTAAPGNFVFRKKKGTLRTSSEMDHMYQYTIGKGTNYFAEDTMELNGMKVNVNELSHEMALNQQKRYLKSLKTEPSVKFQTEESPMDLFSQSSPKKEKRLSGTGTHFKGSNLRSDSLNSNVLANYNNNRFNTLTLDGTSIYSSSTIKSPLRLKSKKNLPKAL
jgi:hypothetical protein